LNIKNPDDEVERLQILFNACQFLKFDPFILNMRVLLQTRQVSNVMGRMSYVTSFPKSGKQGGYNYFVQVDCRNSTEPAVADMMKKDYCKNNQAFVCMTRELNVIENTPKRAPASYSKYVAKAKQVYAEGSNASSGGDDQLGDEGSPEEAVVNPEA